MVRGRSTTSRWSRRSPTRCIRRRARIPRCKPFTTEYDVLGTADEFPIVCTTYRLTEHFHYWTKNNPYNVQLQPEFFVEIPEELAREKGIANGDRVRVTLGARLDRRQGDGHARIKPMQVAGKTTYQIGFPIHWGFLGRGAAARRARQPGHADDRRSELVRARVQGLPGEAGEGVDGRRRLEHRPHRPATTPPAAGRARRSRSSPS